MEHQPTTPSHEEQHVANQHHAATGDFSPPTPPDSQHTLTQPYKTSGSVIQMQRTLGNQSVRRQLQQDSRAILRRRVESTREIMEDTAAIPQQDVIFERMAHDFAYNGVNGADVRWLHRYGYQVFPMGQTAATDGAGGFAMMAFIPYDAPRPEEGETTAPAPTADGEETPPPSASEDADAGRPHLGTPARPFDFERRPVLAFRGTNPTSLEDWFTNTTPEGVGAFQFAINQGLIAGLMQRLNAHGQIDVVGHSLGGALAQYAAVYYSSMIGRVVTFQAAGIDADLVRQFTAQQRGRRGGGIRSTHHRVAGDVVPSFGEAFLPGQVYEYDLGSANEAPVGSILGHGSFPLAELANQRGGSESPLFEDDPARRPSYEEGRQTIRGVDVHAAEGPGTFRGMEGVRQAVGHRRGSDVTDGLYVRIWREVLTILPSESALNQETFEQALHAIYDSWVLTDAFKQVMVMNLRQMYSALNRPPYSPIIERLLSGSSLSDALRSDAAD